MLTIRSETPAGDILPVLSSRDMASGVNAEALLTKDRLKLLQGDWWENTSWGNAVVELLKNTRFTETDQQTLASYLSSYIMETPGVQNVQDVEYSLDGRTFHYKCRIETDYGSAVIQYSV